MTAALVILCVMFAIALASLTTVCILAQRAHSREVAEWRLERRELINRIIAKHALEVAHLDRVHEPTAAERAERIVHDQVGM